MEKLDVFLKNLSSPTTHFWTGQGGNKPQRFLVTTIHVMAMLLISARQNNIGKNMNCKHTHYFYIIYIILHYLRVFN